MSKQKTFCNPSNASKFMQGLYKQGISFVAHGNAKLTVVFYEI